MFFNLDLDRNGTLSKLELHNGIGNICLLELLQDHVDESEESDIEQVFNNMDLDRDGEYDRH